MTAMAYCSRGHYTSPLDFCKFDEKRKNLQENEISKSDRKFLLAKAKRMYKKDSRDCNLNLGAELTLKWKMKNVNI